MNIKNRGYEGDYEQLSRMFHTLMPFKVRDILLVSSLYDAFIIEEEGLISELIIGEYRHLLLSSPPRVTRVHSGERALSKLRENQYDLVITMSKNIGMDPYEFGRKIKEMHLTLPVILLAIDSDDVRLIEKKRDGKGIDRAFYWTGDPTLFLAIIKYVEDMRNAPFDTVNGNVRILIMLEDSIHYYSMFLPLIYTEIVRQTQRAISEDLNEMQRMLTRRARPKILLARTFEEGAALFKQYKEYVLGIITDVRFERRGKMDPNAGYEFSRLVRKESRFIPILMQSAEPEKREKSEAIGTYFLNKNSPNLQAEFQHFLLNHLGFGDFIFLRPKRKKRNTEHGIETPEEIHSETTVIARASNMQQFVQTLQKVPLESIQYHADRNDFSNWLFARCEFKPAMKLRPKKASDFTNLNEVRKYLLDVFNESRREKQLGAITDFSQQKFEFDSSFTRLTGDSLGGKGRGIAFMRSLLARYNLGKRHKNVNVIVPSTVVIGTLEFERFVSDNKLWKFVDRQDASDHEIARAFLHSKIHKELKKNLARLLQHFKSPLAVRSSTLLEDSQHHPFAGLYSTYMLPNNHTNDNIRLRQLCQAIKLVYASVFFEEPRRYIESTPSKIEEEKMAVIIQELVGNDYGGRFYPTFSGVAQSYNFYPVSHQTFEDGIASVAVGLGRIVSSGESALRFSPRYPEIIPEFSTPEQAFENSQRTLYVLDTSRKEFTLSEKDDSTLKRINIADIRSDGTLEYVASTYDRDDGMIRDGLSDDGPILITFAGILKYNVFPLAPLLHELLHIVKTGMGCPVEIEFAVNFDRNRSAPPTLVVLQIRPLAPSYEAREISLDENLRLEKVLLRSRKALGHGITDSIRDIVYIPPGKFDASKTVAIAEEVGMINEKLVSSDSSYILVGPGRWGTQDRWLGVPVRWSQISGVKVMVETALKGFNVEPSQGTHFFQNIVSKGIGYINTTFNSDDSYIDWEWLNNQNPHEEMKYVRHIRLPAPLIITIDGRSGCALIEKPPLPAH